MVTVFQSNEPPNLGCPKYEVYVMARCGKSFTCRIDNLTSVQYTRTLNEVSDATVEATLRDGCCECLATVNPWQHELAVFRNTELVWVGPIIDIEIKPSTESVTFYAKDLFAWTDHRHIELRNNDYDVEGVDLKDAFEWALNHGYCKDPWCMSWSLSPVGVPIDRTEIAFTGTDRWGGRYTNVGEQLRELSRSGVDFTVVGRHLWGGSVQTDSPTDNHVILLDNHWSSTPNIKVSGSSMTTRAIVAGGNGGYYGWEDDQIWVEPPVIGPITPALLDSHQQRFGLLETLTNETHLENEDTTELPNAITQNAKGRWELYHIPFAYITGGALAPEAPVAMTDLIPGAKFQVRLKSCRPLATEYRLYQVSVTADSELERVSIDLSPLGIEGPYGVR